MRNINVDGEVSVKGCCHTSKNILGCDYPSALEYLKTRDHIERLNKKLKEKAKKLWDIQMAWEDYSDKGLDKMQILRDQWGACNEEMSNNTLRLLAELKQRNAKHGYVK